MKNLLSSGLTWQEIQDKINQSKPFLCSLTERKRRSTLRKRKNNIPEDRIVWRLIIQKDSKNYVKTILRKNIRYDKPDLLKQVVSDNIVAKLNNLIANNC